MGQGAVAEVAQRSLDGVLPEDDEWLHAATVPIQIWTGTVCVEMAEIVGIMSLTPSPGRWRLDGVSGRTVAILAFPGFQVLDATGPHEVFAGVGDDVHVVARRAGPVRSESGLAVIAEHWDDVSGPLDTLVVAGGPATRDPAATVDEVRWLAGAAGRARRVATVCTGAFLAARAGLLDGRRATTHWRHANRLQRDHPTVHVESDPIFIRDGNVWTSAGVTAGIDLALALVSDDRGPAVAQQVARELVMFLRRPGGQSQFAAPTWTERAVATPVREAQELIDTAPGGDHRVPVLAARVGMSERNFTRVFAREVGVPPAQYVERVRVDAARRLLEAEPLTSAAVARRCGFGTAETLRRAFHRHLGVAPDDYRRRFATTTATVTSTAATGQEQPHADRHRHVPPLHRP